MKLANRLILYSFVFTWTNNISRGNNFYFWLKLNRAGRTFLRFIFKILSSSSIEYLIILIMGRFTVCQSRDGLCKTNTDRAVYNFLLKLPHHSHHYVFASSDKSTCGYSFTHSRNTGTATETICPCEQETNTFYHSNNLYNGKINYLWNKCFENKYW